MITFAMNTIKLVLDNREGKLKSLLSTHVIFQDNEVLYENLKCGDIVVRVNDVDEFVFERKTIADLAASIVDGRYRLQKTNMLNQFGRDKVFYIIEGDMHYNNYTEMMRIDKKAVHGAVINTIMRDGIRMFFTRSDEETAYLLVEIFTRILKDPSMYKPETKSSGTQDLQHLMSRKSANMPKSDFFIAQLCQVPGVSDKTAHAIVERFQTFPLFYEKISGLEYVEKLNKLKEITTTDNKGNKRRLSSTAAANIVAYIFE